MIKTENGTLVNQTHLSHERHTLVKESLTEPEQCRLDRLWQSMRHIVRVLVLLFFFLVFCLPDPSVAEKTACTLQPREGNKKVQLANGIIADMTWSSCTSIKREVVFSSVGQDEERDPKIALKRAASLLSELENRSGEKVCPFGVDIASVLRARANREPPYKFGDDVPISNIDVPGWDSASIVVRREKSAVRLELKYRANP